MSRVMERVYREKIDPEPGESIRSVLRKARQLIREPFRSGHGRRWARHRFYRAMIEQHENHTKGGRT